MAAMQPSIDDILASIRARVIAPDAPPPSIGIAPGADAPIAAGTPEPLAPPSATLPGVTLEALVAAILTPLLREWLDAHLPEIVQAAAHAEIQRLTARD